MLLKILLPAEVMLKQEVKKDCRRGGKRFFLSDAEPH